MARHAFIVNVTDEDRDREKMLIHLINKYRIDNCLEDKSLENNFDVLEKLILKALETK